jgi:hypothetical protein
VPSPVTSNNPDSFVDERQTYSTFAFGAVLFALAVLVRVAGISWGLPNAERWYSYHPDESLNQIVGAVFRLIQGDPNPGFFNYPSLAIYATWFIYQLLSLIGLSTNVPAPFPWPEARDVIFAGRIFSVLCGAGTAVLVFQIAWRLKMRGGAACAGILLALAPGHVQHSHFATVDVPATFFVALCVYLTLRAKNTRGLIWAAIVAGLAAGTKYNAGLVLIAPLAMLWIGRNGNAFVDETKPLFSQNIVNSLGFLLAFTLAFVISTPYSILDFPSFWGNPAQQAGLSYELLVHPREGSGEIFQGTGNGWIYHLTFNLPFVLTWPLVIAAMWGIWSSTKDGRKWWPIWAFVGLYFFSLGFSQVRFMRYLLPLVPFLCVFAAVGISRLTKSKARIASAILMFIALCGTKDVLWPMLDTDPRDRAANLLRDQPRPVGVVNNPWFYTPPVQPRGFNAPVEGLVVTGFDINQARQTPSFALSEFDWREAARLNPQGQAARFGSELETSYLKSFSYKIENPLALPGRKFVPHDYLYTNPETRVYSLRR